MLLEVQMIQRREDDWVCVYLLLHSDILSIQSQLLMGGLLGNSICTALVAMIKKMNDFPVCLTQVFRRTLKWTTGSQETFY